MTAMKSDYLRATELFCDRLRDTEPLQIAVAIADGISSVSGDGHENALFDTKCWNVSPQGILVKLMPSALTVDSHAMEQLDRKFAAEPRWDAFLKTL